MSARKDPASVDLSTVGSEPPGDPGSEPLSPERQAEVERFRRYREIGGRALRNELIERYAPGAEPHIRRFEGRGQATEDLRQVAMLGLIGAVERFDPEVGVSFATFAGRTIEGELKRMFRDRSWSVRPPRRHQEVFLAVRRAEDDIVQSLGRSPTIAELAHATGTTVDGVLEALEAGGARSASSIDQPAFHRNLARKDTLGGADAAFGQVEIRLLVTELLVSLDERERQVIELRFFDDLGQPEIAERLGLSQSYVSRLIRRTLAELRDTFEA